VINGMQFRYIRVLFALVLIGSGILSRPAMAGGDVSGGGDAVVLEFKRLANEAVAFANRWSAEKPIGFDLDKVKVAVSTVLVSSVETTVLRGTEVDAINNPDEQTIKVNRVRWLALEKNEAAKMALVLHEYLSITGQDDKDYKLSSPFLTYLLQTENKFPDFWRAIGGDAASENDLVSFNCRSVNTGTEGAIRIRIFNAYGASRDYRGQRLSSYLVLENNFSPTFYIGRAAAGPSPDYQQLRWNSASIYDLLRLPENSVDFFWQFKAKTYIDPEGRAQTVASYFTNAQLNLDAKNTKAFWARQTEFEAQAQFDTEQYDLRCVRIESARATYELLFKYIGAIEQHF